MLYICLLKNKKYFSMNGNKLKEDISEKKITFRKVHFSSQIFDKTKKSFYSNNSEKR